MRSLSDSMSRVIDVVNKSHRAHEHHVHGIHEGLGKFIAESEEVQVSMFEIQSICLDMSLSIYSAVNIVSMKVRHKMVTFVVVAYVEL